MADEITILDSDGRNNFTVLFLYPVTTPKQINGTNISHSPSATLPKWADLILSAEEKTALDDGTLAFETLQYPKAIGVSNQQQVEQLREIYISRKAKFPSYYNSLYQFLGTRLNETVADAERERE